MSTDVKLTINNELVTVPAGSTIIEAATKAGVAVPHFCWHPGLSIAGVCRFCMVKVEGMPKLQIACNTPVSEGMKVDTISADVKEAHKWALEFHLINHPLDCPICDQAGECELQNYYMKVGKYDAQMDQNKVLKPKALDVGDTLVLDTERCILCSRCVRFEDEVTKTSTLGIFNRGDVAVIGTYQDRRIKHNYSYNLADICPVGAFTAKDFRFKCRVWFLSETKTVCPGCSTGCNVTLFQNKNQRNYYRLKPRFNAEVNGHWMCDEGRTMFEHLNSDVRLSQPLLQSKQTDWAKVTLELKSAIREAHQAGGIQVLLSPQYTTEEYESLFGALKQELGSIPKVFVWQCPENKPEDFDGILKRGDKHPNSVGLALALQKFAVTAEVITNNFVPLAGSALTLVMGPELEKSYVNFGEALTALSKLKKVVYLGVSLDPAASAFWMRLPTKVFAEKSGTFVNHKGLAQRLKANPVVMPLVKGVDEIFASLLNATSAATQKSIVSSLEG